MRIAILGGGPAGLYLAYLIKRRQPDADIRVFEQNPAGATFGFGVVFSDRALEFLRGDDPETAAAISPHLETWQDITLDQGGERIVLDGVGFSAIGRLAFLRLLQERADTPTKREVMARVIALFEREEAELSEQLRTGLKQTAEDRRRAHALEVHARAGADAPAAALSAPIRPGGLSRGGRAVEPEFERFLARIGEAVRWGPCRKGPAAPD